ncbi:MAG: DUF58 domain-containing protein [Planctomycetes bacterium]|nr:DUF58 domain-containing protein [Planctomycetota bacterium]
MGWMWAKLLPLRALEVRRRLPASATKGEAVRVVHELRNPSGRALRDLIVREWNPAQDPARECQSYFPEVLPSARGESRARLFLGRRGPLELGGLSVFATDPFGLFRVERRIPLRAEVLVRPRPQEVVGRWALEQAQRRSGGAPTPMEWTTVREWRPGDPLRWICWRLTARRGFPIVRTGPIQTAHQAVIVLDVRPGARRIDFERAVAVAAGLGLVLLRRGANLTLVVGNEPPLGPLQGAAGSSPFLERLALVEPDSTASLPRVSGAYLVTSCRLQPGEGGGAALTLESPRLLPGTVHAKEAPRADRQPQRAAS